MHRHTETLHNTRRLLCSFPLSRPSSDIIASNHLIALRNIVMTVYLVGDEMTPNVRTNNARLTLKAYEVAFT